LKVARTSAEYRARLIREVAAVDVQRDMNARRCSRAGGPSTRGSPVTRSEPLLRLRHNQDRTAQSGEQSKRVPAALELCADFVVDVHVERRVKPWDMVRLGDFDVTSEDVEFAVGER
jgi:hypothetical protein